LQTNFYDLEIEVVVVLAMHIVEEKENLKMKE